MHCIKKILHDTGKIRCAAAKTRCSQINSIKIDNQQRPSWIENKNGGGRINLLSPLELGWDFALPLESAELLVSHTHTHTHTHTLKNSHPHFSSLWPQTELYPWFSLFFRLPVAYFGMSHPLQSHKPILIKNLLLHIYISCLFCFSGDLWFIKRVVRKQT